MNKEEIMQFISENPICFLATVEDDIPRVRGIGTYRADERGILIQISTPKDVYKQLVKNPKVELCYNSLAKGVQLRVNGTAEFLEDQGLKEEVVNARPFLKPMRQCMCGPEKKISRRRNILNCDFSLCNGRNKNSPSEYIWKPCFFLTV
jgi:pyridoxamine 5'-phosphate oxidase